MKKTTIVIIVSAFILLWVFSCGDSNKALPKIKDNVLSSVTREIINYEEVSSISTKITGNKINFNIFVHNSHITQEKAEDIAHSLLRLLASKGFYHDGKILKKPNEKYDLGELYDYYAINIGILAKGELINAEKDLTFDDIFDLNNFIYQGSKDTSSPKIIWKKGR